MKLYLTPSLFLKTIVTLYPRVIKVFGFQILVHVNPQIAVAFPLIYFALHLIFINKHVQFEYKLAASTIIPGMVVMYSSDWSRNFSLFNSYIKLLLGKTWEALRKFEAPGNEVKIPYPPT